MSKFISICTVFILLTKVGYSQAWLGSSTSTGGIYRNGNIGINNLSPNFLLDITATTQYQGIQLFQSNGRWIRLYTPSLAGGAFNNIAVNNDAGIVIGNIAGLNTVDHGFVIVPHRGASSGIRITPTGTVGIGTSLLNNPNGYALGVNGKIGAKEIQVENTSSTWADYVFNADYKLMSIMDVESFIVKNKHLPEVPSAEEIKLNGHKLGEMDVLLLKKIEELTLYLIDLKKDVEILKQENEQLKSQK